MGEYVRLDGFGGGTVVAGGGSGRVGNSSDLKILLIDPEFYYIFIAILYFCTKHPNLHLGCFLKHFD